MPTQLTNEAMEKQALLAELGAVGRGIGKVVKGARTALNTSQLGAAINSTSLGKSLASAAGSSGTPLFRRNILSGALVGRNLPWRAPSVPNEFGVAGTHMTKLLGTAVDKGGNKVHYFRQFGHTGKELGLYKHVGSDVLPDLGKLSASDRGKFAAGLEKVLHKGERSHVEKMLQEARLAENIGGIGGAAHHVGVTGGVLGAAARNIVPVAIGGAVLGGVGMAGKHLYSNISTENINRPFGMAANTSLTGELSKRGSMNKIADDDKSAINLAGLLGGGPKSGVMSSLGYTLSTKMFPLSTRVQLPDTMAESFARQVASGAGAASFSALEHAMRGVFGRIAERSVDVPKRRQIMQELRTFDPVLKAVPEETMKSWYNTLASYAPHISLDKNLVSSFLKQVAEFNGQMDYGKLKELMDLEKSYQTIHLREEV